MDHQLLSSDQIAESECKPESEPVKKVGGAYALNRRTQAEVREKIGLLLCRSEGMITRTSQINYLTDAIREETDRCKQTMRPIIVNLFIESLTEKDIPYSPGLELLLYNLLVSEFRTNAPMGERFEQTVKELRSVKNPEFTRESLKAFILKHLPQCLPSCNSLFKKIEAKQVFSPSIYSLMKAEYEELRSKKATRHPRSAKRDPGLLGGMQTRFLPAASKNFHQS